jgi:hypothetical protein
MVVVMQTEAITKLMKVSPIEMFITPALQHPPRTPLRATACIEEEAALTTVKVTILRLEVEDVRKADLLFVALLHRPTIMIDPPIMIAVMSAYQILTTTKCKMWKEDEEI